MRRGGGSDKRRQERGEGTGGHAESGSGQDRGGRQGGHKGRIGPAGGADKRAKRLVSAALGGSLLLAGCSLALLRYGLTHADDTPWDHESPLAQAGLWGVLLFSGGALALALARAWLALAPGFRREGGGR
ncbi:hypothetical protein NYE40_02355 [Paenibacillus sp. FSL W8-1187]|uniref:Uncharacterized protein n=1 Tax=Paenibacillus pasadenensis TaxID=217090 RepID=A0A2N5N0U8_9BACL|nr:hypothetical protein [Paenibacillus pasadenensis]PLT43960.1 hypothetical protein B8V81_2391 [Paenibacillus pasadenensis]